MGHCSVTVKRGLEARAQERRLVFGGAQASGLEEKRMCGKAAYDGKFNAACDAGCGLLQEVIPIQECSDVDEAVKAALNECQNGYCYDTCCYPDQEKAKGAKADGDALAKERMEDTNLGKTFR